MTTADQWTWNRAIEQAHERLAARGIKRLPQPIHAFRDLGEIEYIENLGR